MIGVKLAATNGGRQTWGVRSDVALSTLVHCKTENETDGSKTNTIQKIDKVEEMLQLFYSCKMCMDNRRFVAQPSSHIYLGTYERPCRFHNICISGMDG